MTEQNTDDARLVDVVFAIQPPTILHSASSGLVTSVAITPGTPLISGTPALDIDGDSVIALRSSAPLWRSLKDGDTGQDVEALQEELSSLGYPIVVDGEVGPHTLRAIADLLDLSIQERESFDTIDPSRFLWIPHSPCAVSSVFFEVGKIIDPSTDLFSVGNTLNEARIAEVPMDLIPGERVLAVGDKRIAVNAEGLIQGDQLALLEGTNEFQSMVKDPESSQPLSGKYMLREAVTVYAVSPAAIYGIDGSRACLTDGKQGFAITVTLSELGKSLVYFDDAQTAPDRVLLSPAEQIPCG